MRGRCSYKCPLCSLVAPTTSYIIDHQIFAHSGIVKRREDALVVVLPSSQGDDFDSPDEPITFEVTCDATPHTIAGNTQSSQHESDNQSQRNTQGSSSHGGHRPVVWSPLGIEIFLQIVEAHLSLLNDNKTKKIKVWSKIARELNAKLPGWNFTASQCRQKWSNLVKAYKKYIDNVNKTGAPPIPQPPYFDVLHGFLRGSHSIEPRNLFESGRTMVGSLRSEASAFASDDDILDADPDIPPPAAPRASGPAVLSEQFETGTRVAGAGPSTRSTGPTGLNTCTEAGTTAVCGGPFTQVSEPAGPSTRPEAGTPVAGAGLSRSRRQRVTPPSHNAQVRKLLQDVVDQLKESVQIEKDSEASRARHRELIIKELRRFNDNYESLHGKRGKKRRHESDSE